MKLIILLLSTIIALAAGDACKDGNNAGYDEALAIWEDYKKDCKGSPDFEECVCSSAWNFDRDVKRVMSNRRVPGRRGYYGKSFSRCYKQAADVVLREKEKECFASPDNCKDLAETAARIIGMSQRIIHHNLSSFLLMISFV